jgi:hypothetical protein
MTFIREKKRMNQEKLSKEELEKLIHTSLVKIDAELTNSESKDVIPEQVQYGVLLSQLISSMCLTMLDTNGLDDFCEQLTADIKNTVPKIDEAFFAALDNLEEEDPSCAAWSTDCLLRASKIIAETIEGR